MRLNEAALQVIKDSGISMADFRLSDEAREILHGTFATIKEPKYEMVVQDMSNDYDLESRLATIEPEIRQYLLDANLTEQDLMESCDRVRKYWHLIGIQRKASGIEETT